MERIDQKRMMVSLPPERVLQFGEGNFLRAFVDWMFHRMNESGVFGGSAVVVQPLENGLVEKLNDQKGLYTLYLRGIQNGEQLDSHEVISSISRGINPYSDWGGFLETAANPDMRFVVSNTTEAGIAYQRMEPPDSCPASFPAKLTAWLVRRFELLGGTADSAMIFMPCELINYNGRKLKECILKHAADWKLGGDFDAWIENDCIFLSTLVDRIVPGYPGDEAESMIRQLGYSDDLICTGEIFHLLVIEGPEELKAELPFHKAGLNVVWTDDMQPYRNLKVSILNGAHTSSVLAAYLGGLDIVREMVEDGLFGRYVQSVLFNEIMPTLDVEREEAKVYAGAVLERFRNPFIRHELLSISLNSVSKWKVRVLPSVKNYIVKFGEVPLLLAFSMAALIAFYKGDLRDGYEPNDDPAVLEFFQTAWSGPEVVARVLEHTDFWGEDLTALPGFELEVSKALGRILHGGMRKAVKDWLDHEDA